MSLQPLVTSPVKSSIEAASVSVVIPCYTEERWDSLLRAIDSAVAQPLAESVIVVVDHNDILRRRLIKHARTAWERARPGLVRIEANRHAQGVSGARNTGAELVGTELIAFLDDDAVASGPWLEALRATFADPTVVGAGGSILPAWSGAAPAWFPGEFGWVYGVTGPFDDQEVQPVRNVWSVNMMVRRAAFEQVAGFRLDFGKLGTVAEPEDTDLCLRMSAATAARWVMTPRAAVSHEVVSTRATLRYFFRRCWQEGVGKRHLQASKPGESLSSENTFLRRTLPRAVGRNLRQTLGGDHTGLLRVAVLLAGTATTVASYLVTRPDGSAPDVRNH